MEHQAAIEGHVQRMSLITSAMMMSVVIVMGIGWFLSSNQGAMTAATEDVPMLPMILAGAGVLALIASGAVGGALARAARTRATPEERLTAFGSAHIVATAMRESAAIVGLVATMVSGDPTWVLALGVLALVAIAASWPRRERFAELVRTPPVG